MTEEEIALKITRLESDIRVIVDKINNTEKLTESVAVLCNEMKHFREEMTTMQNDLKVIKDKPANWLNTILVGIITATISAAVTYFFAH